MAEPVGQQPCVVGGYRNIPCSEPVWRVDKDYLVARRDSAYPLGTPICASCYMHHVLNPWPPLDCVLRPGDRIEVFVDPPPPRITLASRLRSTLERLTRCINAREDARRAAELLAYDDSFFEAPRVRQPSPPPSPRTLRARACHTLTPAESKQLHMDIAAAANAHGNGAF